MEKNTNVSVNKSNASKIGGVVVLLIFVAVIAFFFLNKKPILNNKPIPLNPNQKIVKAVLDIKGEYEDSINDFYKPLGLGEIFDKIEKGQLGLSLNGTIAKEVTGMPEDLTIGFSLSNDQPKKQALLAVEAKMKDQSLIQGSFMIDKDSLMLDLPSFLDKAVSINMKTLGEDLSKSSLVVLMEANEDSLKEIENLSIDFWKSPTTSKEIESALTEAIKPESKAFTDKLDFTELEAQTVTVGKKEVSLEVYETLVPKDELIALVKSLQKALMEINKDKITGLKSLEQQISSEEMLDKTVESFEQFWAQFEEPVKLIVGMDDSKARLLQFTNKIKGQAITISVKLLGEEHTVDTLTIVIEGNDATDKGEVTLAINKDGDVNTLAVTSVGPDGETIEVVKLNYHTNNQDLTVDVLGNKLIAQFQEIVKNESFELVIKDIIASGVSEDSVMAGVVKDVTIKVGKPVAFEIPENVFEILKANEEDTQNFMGQTIVKIMMLMSQLGLEIPIE